VILRRQLAQKGVSSKDGWAKGVGQLRTSRILKGTLPLKLSPPSSGRACSHCVNKVGKGGGKQWRDRGGRDQLRADAKPERRERF